MRAPTVQVGRSAVTMRASGIKESYTWATVLDTSDLRPGSVASGVAFNQEIAVVATPDGSLYACTNKAPPTGQPLTFSRPGADKTIQDPVCGTKWDLETGEVKPGTWMSSLLPGAILKLFLKEPERLSVFPIRTQGSKVQVVRATRRLPCGSPVLACALRMPAVLSREGEWPPRVRSVLTSRAVRTPRTTFLRDLGVDHAVPQQERFRSVRWPVLEGYPGRTGQGRWWLLLTSPASAAVVGDVGAAD